jgi:7-cyano-7-deazaguanine reductase
MHERSLDANTPAAPHDTPHYAQGALHLGQSSRLPDSPEEAQLDYVPNPRVGSLYLVRFAAPEFTSLCPVTGQPDFAHLVIDYAPGETIVESKSLKLFLGSFRNHAGFHEDVTVGIGQRLFDEMKPRWLRIGGYWYPRGGIPSMSSGSRMRRPPGSGCPIRRGLLSRSRLSRAGAPGGVMALWRVLAG